VKYARKENVTARSPRPKRREIRFHASRRVRARGNAPRAQWQTQSSIKKAGGCHRTIESAASRSKGKTAFGAKIVGGYTEKGAAG
jgi:hypothetical protein